MPDAPMPLKVVLGLAATAVDEARKLPETLPAAVSKAPVLAVTTAMGASLRLQQRLTELAIRGEELLSQLRGTSEQPPSWATFDDPPAEHPEGAAPRAAFDLIDYQDAGDDADDEPAGPPAPPTGPSLTTAPAKKAAAKKVPAKAVKKAPLKKVPLKKVPLKKAPLKAAPVKESPAEVAAKMATIAAAPPPAKKAPAKASPRKASARGGGAGLSSDLAGDLAAALEDSPEA
jgi:hypothetical protein